MRPVAAVADIALLALSAVGAQAPVPRVFSKHVLACTDVRNGELWGTPWLQQIYFQALKWSMDR